LQRSFIDPNPGKHSIEFEVPDNAIELIEIQDQGELTFYYACPECKTDGYLVDIEKVLN